MKKKLKKNVSNEAEAMPKKDRNISPGLHTYYHKKAVPPMMPIPLG